MTTPLTAGLGGAPSLQMWSMYLPLLFR